MAGSLSRVLSCVACSALVALPAAAGERNAGQNPPAASHQSQSCPDCPRASHPPRSAAPAQKGAQQPAFLEVFGATDLHLVQDNPPQFSVERIAGTPGTSIPIRISLPSLLKDNGGGQPAYTFLMFRGIPDGISLSSGFRTRNAWVVAVNDVENLKIQVPKSIQGDFPIEVIFYNGEASTPEKRSVILTIAPAERSKTVASRESPPPSPAPTQADAPSPTALAVPTPEDAELLRQGEAQLRNGNIVFARLLFEQLASRGSAQGAFAVAQTYDPVVLKQIAAVGMQGDSEKAKFWYRKAAELGNVPVTDIISALKKDR
jgi:hypothetical protein